MQRAWMKYTAEIYESYNKIFNSLICTWRKKKNDQF